MFSGKKILTVVPARGGSKGIKLKNLRCINGVSLVALVGEVIHQLDWIDRAVVSTDHKEIAKVAKEAGLDVPFMRPDSISGDLISDWQVLHHALLSTEKDDSQIYDIILMLQPTSPLRRPEHILAVVKKIIERKFDAVWTITKTDSKFHPLKQLVFKNQQLDYYDSKAAEIIARQQLNPTYHLNGIAYAFTRNCILKQKVKKGRNTSAVIIKDPVANIDTEDDLRLAETIIKKGFNK